MTLLARRFAILLFAFLAASPAFAQPAPRGYSQAELDQMLAPIALYPDPVLQQVFIAATRPLEAAEALVEFPQILQRMRENPDWARALGEAIVYQEPAVMDTVQQLRARAQAAGNLQSNEQMTVQQQGPAIVIQPASPQVVYVPYYDPLVVYGPWWWPAYRPVAWTPWPNYARPYVATGFWWGQPAISPARQMQLRTQHVPAPQQVSPARQMQLRTQQMQERPSAQVRTQPQARMPAAVAPPQPRADFRERRESHPDPRNEPRGGGRNRS